MTKKWNDAVCAGHTWREAKRFHLVLFYPFIHADPLLSHHTPDDLYTSNCCHSLLKQLKRPDSPLKGPPSLFLTLSNSGPPTRSHPPSHPPSMYTCTHGNWTIGTTSPRSKWINQAVDSSVKNWVFHSFVSTLQTKNNSSLEEKKNLNVTSTMAQHQATSIHQVLIDQSTRITERRMIGTEPKHYISTIFHPDYLSYKFLLP